MEVQKVMDRKKVADTLHTIMDTSVELLGKGELDRNDHAKIKVIRTTSGIVNAAVSMVQQETAQQRIAVVTSKLKELGYEVPKELE